jgi:NAD(P)H-flavin reductase
MAPLPEAPPPDAVAPAPVTGADPLIPRVARIGARRRETGDVFTLEIEPDGPGGGVFAAGQFNMLTAFGVGEVPISLSGDPGDPTRLIHTIRDVGAVTAALGRLKKGGLIGLRGPFGRGWPMEAAAGRDVVLVAGGVALAPLRPALYRLLAERERYGNVTLLYGARSPNDILYRRELEKLRRRFDVDIEVTVDHAVSEWHGHVGVVTTLIPRAAIKPSNTVAFICGPEVMTRFTIMALREAGVADDAIHIAMERNMKCAAGFCGRCQFGGDFVCRDGPVFPYARVRPILHLKEI